MSHKSARRLGFICLLLASVGIVNALEALAAPVRLALADDPARLLSLASADAERWVDVALRVFALMIAWRTAACYRLGCRGREPFP
jgi:hypothetical protein